MGHSTQQLIVADCNTQHNALHDIYRQSLPEHHISLFQM